MIGYLAYQYHNKIMQIKKKYEGYSFFDECTTFCPLLSDDFQQCYGYQYYNQWF